MPLQINDTLIQRALAVLRIVTAYLLIQHGTAKHFGFPHVAMFDNLVDRCRCPESPASSRSSAARCC